MTRDATIGAAGPSRRRRSLPPLLVSAVVLASVVIACSTATPSPSPGALGSQGPVASQQAGGTGPTPKPTAWPGATVSAVIALGAGDESFQRLAKDLQTTVDKGDLQGMLQVTNDGLTFLKGAQQNIPHLQAYSETKPLGDSLAAAYQQMISGLQQIHDSLVSGNAAGVTSGFQEFAAGNEAYGALRAELSDKAQQAIFMQRIYYR
jgi:hypothetical protein